MPVSTLETHDKLQSGIIKEIPGLLIIIISAVKQLSWVPKDPNVK